jgi:hypothetical protein
MRFAANTSREICCVPYTNKGKEIAIEIIAFAATTGNRDEKNGCGVKCLLMFSVIAEREMLNLLIWYYTKKQNSNIIYNPVMLINICGLQ